MRAAPSSQRRGNCSSGGCDWSPAPGRLVSPLEAPAAHRMVAEAAGGWDGLYGQESQPVSRVLAEEGAGVPWGLPEFS